MCCINYGILLRVKSRQCLFWKYLELAELFKETGLSSSFSPISDLAQRPHCVLWTGQAASRPTEYSPSKCYAFHLVKHCRVLEHSNHLKIYLCTLIVCDCIEVKEYTNPNSALLNYPNILIKKLCKKSHSDSGHCI